MKVLHGTWIPQSDDQFIQKGNFCLWVETAPTTGRQGRKKKIQSSVHPQHLLEKELKEFLQEQLGIKTVYPQSITQKYFLLPTDQDKPLPSNALTRYLESELNIPNKPVELQVWEINCYSMNSIIATLQDLHFLALYESNEWQLGNDLLFWYSFSQVIKQVIFKDQYIPAWQYQEILPDSRVKTTTRTRKTIKPQPPIVPEIKFHATWEIISDFYETKLQEFTNYIPPICLAGRDQPHELLELYEPVTLLRHFSECLLQDVIKNSLITLGVEAKLKETPIIYQCIKNSAGFSHRGNDADGNQAISLQQYEDWQKWRIHLVSGYQNNNFYLGFRLREPHEATPDQWYVEFLVISKSDPSLKLSLDDYWYLSAKKKKELQQHFGQDLEREILLNLGYATRIYPLIASGLTTDIPIGFHLNLQEAFEFLKENAWVLEDAGYKVIVPAWWTPIGRQRAKLRMKASGKSLKTPDAKTKKYFSVDKIAEYRYELAIGDQPVSEEEWEKLVQSKAPLVLFRGQWVELDAGQMQKMLEFWQNNQDVKQEISMIDLLKSQAGIDDDLIEVETDEILGEMLSRLNDPSRLEMIDHPAKLQGTLREYQRRGVSWLEYMEKLGLNGCLADDMGLGKTIQVIAKLVIDRSGKRQKLLPTLLIAPTSVVGNWEKEVAKFAPHLKVKIHHGTDRHQEEAEFKKDSLKYDLVITSFTLVRKDEKLFNSLTWQRIVIDEAQNIKNPKAAQTKAILKLQSEYRLALTGTPVENRLLDLWSIFNFLNPGYLGKESQFRQAFEIPIQKENNSQQAKILKKLVEPFILRRVKTDQNIIKDLPDKIEQKQYCNLTKEQASLYAAVVKEVEGQLDNLDGIQRKGMILSTLLKLKQICNHPRQFLQDNSEFTPQRSHKLERLGEMIEEAINEGDSLLIFTQFTEIGDALHKYLKQQYHYNVYYLHGGTPSKKRQAMINEFQDAQTEPSIFILSLKAGGVGITLTKANHVFHFDRWWNPSVENQATDRAFRIGQNKKVFVHKFVTLGTLEEKIDEMIEDKKKLANMVVSSDESWLTELDNDSFKQLIALNKQTII
jgi:SNF2 family DNA or RNA helicase